MQRTVEANKTLLVDGPAVAKLVYGKAQVFGFQPRCEEPVLVNEGKRLPFYTLEKSCFVLSLGTNAVVQEVEGNTVPQSWNEPATRLLAAPWKPLFVMVLGKSDSGKSSFCTYLVNALVAKKCRVAVLDGDLGQSDIGPSTTVGYAVASSPIINLSSMKLLNAVFVGVTSPIEAQTKTIMGLKAMKAEALRLAPDFLVVNTDGWVAGELAVQYKTSLVKALEPSLVVAIQMQDELETLLANLKVPVIRVASTQHIYPRTAEKRRTLRETTYARYLKDATLRCYRLSHVAVESNDGFPLTLEPKQGLLVGFYGSQNRFLGIGVLRNIDEARKVLKIQTSVSAQPERIVLGKVWLDQKLQEIKN